MPTPLNIAITHAGSPLGQALTTHLPTAGLQVQTTDVDVLDIDQVQSMCANVDRVIHLPGTQPNTDAARILDTALKGTHNVMHAARQAGVTQVVQISDVCIYDGYDDDHILSEDMVPLPDTSAEQQALHLAEMVGHEFARETPGSILTLRLGRLVDTASLSKTATFDRDWLDITDAVAAITHGLTIDSYDHPTHWGLYNLVADTPHKRFHLRIREGRFAFQPQVDFKQWWPS